MNQRIKLVRTNAGLTQDQFADCLNKSRNYIFLIEKGERTPSEYLLQDISKRFCVSLDWLTTGQGPMHPAKTRDDEISDIITAASSPGEAEKAVKFFRSLFDGMTEAEIILMYEVLKRHFPTE